MKVKPYSFLLLLLCSLYSYTLQAQHFIGSITGTKSVCKGSTTTLKDATTGGRWRSGSASIASVGASTGTVTGITTGTAIITYTAGRYHVTAIVTVYPVVAIFVSAGTILCNGGTTTVTVSGSGGAGNLNGVGTRTVLAGTYTYTVTDIDGCAATTTFFVTQPPLLEVSTSVSPATPVPGAAANTIYLGYGPASVTLGATASGGKGGYHYRWMPGAGSGSSFTVSPTATTMYIVIVTDGDGCQATQTITINVINARSHRGNDVNMCHRGRTVSVGQNAVSADLEHGYSLGPCPR